MEDIYLNGKLYVMLRDADIEYRGGDLNPNKWYSLIAADKETKKCYEVWFRVPDDINEEDYDEPSLYIDWDKPNDMEEINPDDYWLTLDWEMGNL